MAFLYLFAILVVVFVVWRILSPGDVRLNRVYLQRYLKDSKGAGPKRISVKRIPAVIPAGQPEEKVCYHIEASFASEGSQQLTAQVFYPLEALQMERDKQKKPLATDDLNPNSITSGPANQTSDEIEKLKEDPLKEITEEHKFAERKAAGLQLEISQLRLLNQYTEFFPRLLSHDNKNHITLLGPVGFTRLDELLHRASHDEKLGVLRTLVENLARFHKDGQMLADNLLPGMSHSEDLIRGQIGGAFEGFVLAGASLTEFDIHEVIDAARTLIDIGAAEMGPKLMDASPRAFFVHQGIARPLDFGRVRRDISAIDMVELICDPSTGLTPTEELYFYEVYANNRFDASDTRQEGLQMLTRLSIYYRLVLAGYLVKHFIALKKSEPAQRAALEIKFWTSNALPQAVEGLRFFLARDIELSRLKDLLDPKLEDLARYRA